MCTSIIYKTKDSYFGRTLDNEIFYDSSIVLTPRNYTFTFKNKKNINNHYAILGMAVISKDYPLYFDAINEKGVGIAGLNFLGNAHYNDMVEGKDNIAPYELIPWILGQCKNIHEVLKLIKDINIIGIKFSNKFPISKLHWLICDKDQCITVESLKDGIHVYKNTLGVLTNNPPFPFQVCNLSNYRHLSPKQPKNNFSPNIHIPLYSRGMGAIGLPGDLSSESRFVRAAFLKENSVSGDSEEESISQFFHVLDSVNQPRGCCEVRDGKYEITIYTSCCNLDKGIYYYTAYDNHQITAVYMHNENLDTSALYTYPFIQTMEINKLN